MNKKLLSLISTFLNKPKLPYVLIDGPFSHGVLLCVFPSLLQFFDSPSKIAETACGLESWSIIYQ